jgi:tripartite-type tricarboxylate transporter receptor subunit TctC
MNFIKKILLLLLLSPTLPALGQDYPSRPITLVVPFSAGGPGDVIARLLGSSMSATLKQPLVIENVVGAGGTIGTNRVAKAAADGYTLLLMHVGQATAPALYAKLPFDPVGDFAPIGMVTDVPMILVARPNFPAKDLKELIAYVRAQGDKLTYGNVGLGSASHLCGLMFMSAIETKLTAVYYKGGGPALNDVIAGHIDVYAIPRPDRRRISRPAPSRAMRLPATNVFRPCRTCQPRRKPACRPSTSRPGTECTRRATRRSRSWMHSSTPCKRRSRTRPWSAASPNSA